jgi:ribonuclease P protein component
MLPRTKRLPRAAFAGLLRKGKRSETEHFSGIFASTHPEGGCAVVVPKKAAASSVVRHLIKRRVMAVIRPSCAPGRALVITARSGAAGLSYKALAEEVSALLATLGVPRS